MVERSPDNSSSENIHCIWVDAGVVAYKLCDRGLDCDNCSFHHGMLQHAHAQAQFHEAGSEWTEPSSTITGESLSEDTIDALIDRLLSPIRRTGFPQDRRYSLRHMWVAPAEDGECFIGMDHVVPGLVSSIHGIVLPRRLTRLHRETPFAWLLAGPGVLPLPSPLSGVIVDSNQNLTDHPEWLMGSPYDQAWIVRATCDSTESPEPFLVAAEQVRLSSQFQIEKMREWIREHALRHHAQQPTLCDGGSFVRSLQELLGQKLYPHFVREFLSIQPR